MGCLPSIGIIVKPFSSARTQSYYHNFIIFQRRQPAHLNVHRTQLCAIIFFLFISISYIDNLAASYNIMCRLRPRSKSQESHYFPYILRLLTMLLRFFI